MSIDTKYGYRAKAGLSADALKWIAVLAMLIDHSAAVLLAGPLFQSGLPADSGAYSLMSALYNLARIIGRTAFPIYCFLLVEGFFHTRSLTRYAGRLLVFALLSEIPYDLALYGRLTLGGQNVYFTLLIGLLTIQGLHLIKALSGRALIRGIAGVCVLAAGMFSATVLSTDYSYTGVVLIACLYLFRDSRRQACRYSPAFFLASMFLKAPAGLASLTEIIDIFLIEVYCLAAFILILRCNGKRGARVPKYFFYAFYPVHLMLLYLLAQLT